MGIRYDSHPANNSKDGIMKQLDTEMDFRTFTNSILKIHEIGARKAPNIIDEWSPTLFTQRRKDITPAAIDLAENFSSQANIELFLATFPVMVTTLEITRAGIGVCGWRIAVRPYEDGSLPDPLDLPSPEEDPTAEEKLLIVTAERGIIEGWSADINLIGNMKMLSGWEALEADDVANLDIGEAMIKAFSDDLQF